MAAEGVQSKAPRPRRTFTVLHLRSGRPPCAMRSRGAVSMSEMPTMNPRRSAGRWLACALLIACWTQAGAVVVHHHVPALLGEHSTGGNSGGQHDPATCVLCHFISQLRAQCGSPPSLSIPLCSEVVLVLSELAAVLPAQPPCHSHAPRAPPSSPIA